MSGCTTLDWLSFYVELFTIEALSGNATRPVATDVIRVLEAAAADLEAQYIVDPANTNNIISGSSTRTLRRRRWSLQAAKSAGQQCWESVILVMMAKKAKAAARKKPILETGRTT